ncbi:2-phosphosulfolactate phosphatase [Nocardioides donggukensis]|uniref:2-phosphosulfolactate phosphatase n=1 Tax=Nocardioides donggukensis TaxID=2774019 RepID=UPI00191D5FB7|nr:2-phosphosulfolactate phosphatase [Nocardioides donggukensis]
MVDVLSFSTTLTVAVERGIEVFPFRWADARAAAYASECGAVLAVGRSEARDGEVSLSPASVRRAVDVDRLVLPSPNGSTISSALASSGTTVLGGCLRNAASVARSVADLLDEGRGPLTVVAAGERWPDDSLRPADEDLWGAGAILAALDDRGVGGFAQEARTAERAFRSVRDELGRALVACESGAELIGKGYADDVAIAGEVDSCEVVPILEGERFVPR